MKMGIKFKSVKEAIAERIERGETSGSADLMVKGVPVHVEFKSKGNNPCPDSLKDKPNSGEWEKVSDPYGDQRTQKTWKKGDVIIRIKYLPHSRRYEVRKDDVSRDKLLASESADSFKSAVIIAERMRESDNPSKSKSSESSEGKIKVFNPEKVKLKEEEEVEEAISEEKSGEVKEVKRKEEEEVLKCPKCDAELTKVKKIEDGGFLKADLKKGFSPYICEDCRQLYQVKDLEKLNPKTNDSCPYCEEELYNIKSAPNYMWCGTCRKLFAKD